MNGEQREAAYAPPVEVTRASICRPGSKGLAGGTPHRRVDLSGKSGDPFVAQWVGPLETLEAQLKAHGFEIMPQWTWSAALAYSDPHAPFDTVPPPTLAA